MQRRTDTNDLCCVGKLMKRAWMGSLEIQRWVIYYHDMDTICYTASLCNHEVKRWWGAGMSDVWHSKNWWRRGKEREVEEEGIWGMGAERDSKTVPIHHAKYYTGAYSLWPHCSVSSYSATSLHQPLHFCGFVWDRSRKPKLSTEHGGGLAAQNWA